MIDIIRTTGMYWFLALPLWGLVWAIWSWKTPYERERERERKKR